MLLFVGVLKVNDEKRRIRKTDPDPELEKKYFLLCFLPIIVTLLYL